MKKILVTSIFAITVLYQGCQQKDDIESDNLTSGSVAFLIQSNEGQNENTRIFSEDIPSGSMLKIGIETADEAAVSYEYTLELLSINGEFISPPILLSTGDYILVEFLVINPDNEVIYAAPLAGSELASDVDEPLPIPFSIQANTVIQINPEVVNLKDFTAEDAGYVSFSLNTVDYFFVSVFRLEETNFVLTDAQAYILDDGDTLKSVSLESIINRVALNLDEDKEFTLVVIKNGYAMYSKEFTLNGIIDEYQNTIPITLIPALTFIASPSLSFSDELDFSIPIGTPGININVGGWNK